jgi:hypothetical protein
VRSPCCLSLAALAGLLRLTRARAAPRRLEPQHFRILGLPVAEFLATSPGDAAQAPQRSGTFQEFARQVAGVRAPVAVSPTTPFIRVMELLGGSSPRIHRVYITEGGRPIGVVRSRPGCAWVHAAPRPPDAAAPRRSRPPTCCASWQRARRDRTTR